MASVNLLAKSLIPVAIQRVFIVLLQMIILVQPQGEARKC